MSSLTTCATLAISIAPQLIPRRNCFLMCSCIVMTCSSSQTDGSGPRTSLRSLRNCPSWPQWLPFPKTPSPRQTRLLLLPTLPMVVEMTIVGTKNTAVYDSATCDKPHSKDLSIGKAVTILGSTNQCQETQEGERGAFSRIFASASSSDGTRIFIHESQVLDTSGLAVALESGTNTLPGFDGFHEASTGEPIL